MYGWVKTLCSTRFCHQTQKKNHVSAKKWNWWQSPLGLDEDSNERKTLPAGWELSCIMEKHFRFLNEKNDFGSRLSLSHGVCYRCVELHLKLEENMLFWFYEFILLASTGRYARHVCFIKALYNVVCYVNRF